MQEQLITFETAKLAKEKGFYYMKANCFGDNMCYQLPEGEFKCAHNGSTITGYILAPTQSLLQKWLREEHSIDVLVTRENNPLKYSANIYLDSTGVDYDYLLSKYETYEEALEEGLRQALSYI